MIDTSQGDREAVLSSYVVVAPPDTPLGNEQSYYSDPASRKEAVLSTLERQFGPEARDIAAYHDKNWDEEPFQNGCAGRRNPLGGSRNRSPVGRLDERRGRSR